MGSINETVKSAMLMVSISPFITVEKLGIPGEDWALLRRLQTNTDPSSNTATQLFFWKGIDLLLRSCCLISTYSHCDEGRYSKNWVPIALRKAETACEHDFVIVPAWSRMPTRKWVAC